MRNPWPWISSSAAGVVLVCLVSLAHGQAEEEQALGAVRARIQALEQRLERERLERDRGSEALRRVELEVAAAGSELERLRKTEREQASRRQALERETAEVRRRLDSERDALAEQLRLSYMNGREELFKLLLSQESPAALGRMMVYYDYYNRARSERIAAVGAELEALARLAEESERLRREIAVLERAQAAELERLAALREERRQVLAELERTIAAGGTEVERLREEEQRLVELVTELTEVLSAFPVNLDEPFTSLRGRLVWPVRGEVAANFGNPRQGGPMRWNGVLLHSEQGANVRAIYHGRVAFADWLPGLGLLIIVDHGDGYMSLYGHNEALLKEAGDWVSPGEAIALVGDTGGLAQPSLYFEIRANGSPVDPHGWMTGGQSAP
jgi:murein hydrolase activator